MFFVYWPDAELFGQQRNRAWGKEGDKGLKKNQWEDSPQLTPTMHEGIIFYEVP